MVTIDTNIAFYALAIEGSKAARASDVLELSDFLSVQVLNEYAFSVKRKLARDWNDIGYDLDLLRNAVPVIHSINSLANRSALEIADRYQLSFYDAVMIAVALANGATTLYSEDMQHGMVIDDKLTILNPFLAPPELT
jgi:predicted nucleic acid-binding protein